MKSLNVLFVAIMAVVLLSLSSCDKNGVTLGGINGGVSVDVVRDTAGKYKIERVQLWLSGNTGYGNYYSPFTNNYGGNYANWYNTNGITTGVFFVTGPPTNLLKVPICDRWGNIVGTALCTDVPIYYPNSNIIHYPGKFTQLQNRDYNALGWAPVYVSVGNHQTDRDPMLSGEIVQ